MTTTGKNAYIDIKAAHSTGTGVGSRVTRYLGTKDFRGKPWIL